MSQRGSKELKDLYIGALQCRRYTTYYEKRIADIYLQSHIPVKEEEYALDLIKKHHLEHYGSILRKIYNRNLTKWKNKVKKNFGIIIQKDIDSIIFSFI